MRNLSLQSGIGTDPAYLNGKLVDNQTIIGEGINQDLVQFFQKLAALASITPNNLPDNETNGYQLITALEAVVRAYSASTTQRGTSERATQTEVNAGTDTERYIAPNTLRGTTFVNSQIPLLETSKIPNLDASKITSGTFDPARIPQATETAVGGAEIATTTEINTGTDDTKIVTPLKLASRTANTTRAGIIETSTQAETIALSSSTVAVTPNSLAGLFSISWITQTLLNGWTGSIKARVDGLGYVEIIGFVNGSSATNTAMCTLTASQRPGYSCGFSMHDSPNNNIYSGIYDSSTFVLRGFISPFPTSGTWFFYLKIPQTAP